MSNGATHMWKISERMHRHNEKYGVTDSESFALVRFHDSNGYATFTFWGPVNRFGARNCGVQSIPLDQVRENINALVRLDGHFRYRVFNADTGEQLTEQRI